MEIVHPAAVSVFAVLLVIALIIAWRMKSQKKAISPFFLYADAQPSEAIQSDELPGLAVACVLPYKKGRRILDVPVKQYKEYDKWQKADRAKKLTEWLKEQRENGLVITGFLMARTLLAAATYGLDLVEELPDTTVEPHYGKYRLFFDGEPISFSQAVALMYYSFVLNFAVLRASNFMKPGQRNMVIFLDSFPGTSQGNLKPGQRPSTKSQGMKFIEFVRMRSKTAIGIDEANSERGINFKTDSLIWWRRSTNGKIEEGKKHPHFTLVDWITASARAHHFKNDFIKTFDTPEQGNVVAQALCDLYGEFKKFDIWEIADDNTLNHIKSNEQLWKVPEDARNFILSLTTS